MSEALKLAEAAGLDLVEVSPEADPPVAKIVDWGKYNYQRTKQQNKSRGRAKSVEIKQIRVGLKIGAHDLDIKLKKTRQFLEAGHKVKITVIYRGREMAHQDLGFALAKRIVEALGSDVIVEQPPQLLGKWLNMVVRSNTNAKVKDAQRAEKTPAPD